MASLLRAFVFLALAAAVSAQTHHVVGGDRGWGPDSDLNSWLSGRVFTVGDKILFKYSGTEDSIVELKSLEDFLSCDLKNPIQMYTDPTSHVSLDNEGPRYFASSDPERCKNGQRLPVHVRPSREYDPDEPSEFDPPFPYQPPSPHGEYPPFKPTPPYDPPVKPTPPYDPPVLPPPSPPHVRPTPPPPPYQPSGGNRLGAWAHALALAGGVLVVGI